MRLLARASRDAVPDRVFLTGHERTFQPSEIIVSKTDPRGILTYVNEVFIRVSGYEERELIGRPHSLIRHPHMPRCIFKLLWNTISSGNELFAYVNNRCKNGDNYWVLAHVTPTCGPNGRITGYHSSRRVPSEAALRIVKPLYERLYEEEQRHPDGRISIEAGTALLQSLTQEAGKAYDQFILSL